MADKRGPDMNDKENSAKNQQSGQTKRNVSNHLEKGIIEMPAEKAYYLQKTQVLDDLQKELIQWAKKRFWIITAIVIVLGFFGSSLLIRETVRGLVEKEIEDANKAAIIARESATRAAIATEEVAKQAQTYAKTVIGLQEKASQVDTQFTSIRQRLEAETANVKADAARETKDIATRLTHLEKLVAGVVKQPQTSQQAVATYQKEIVELKEVAFNEGKKFGENSAYYVTVYYNEQTIALSAKIVEKLTQAGFKAASSSILTLRFLENITLVETFIKPSEVKVQKGEITVNTIIHDIGLPAYAKAKEIGDLLRPLVDFSQIRPPGTNDPIGIVSSSSMSSLLGVEKRIAVFVVKKA